MVAAIADAMLDPLFWEAKRIGQPSAWWMHVPFAHWAVAACAPKLLVELGTHTGVSYAAFCEAVRASKCGARCYAVDTWEGDAHAGNYGDHVYTEMKGFNDARYSGFSELIRSTFDDALKYFEDGTVDLLHIDGFHTYEAVKHDFETWLPKLSDRGVVILHDTNVKRDDFGVYKFFGELQKHYPSFEFSHGFGLGIVAVGKASPAAILDLCNVDTPEKIAAIRDRFSFAGNRWLVAAREALDVGNLSRQLGEHQGRLRQADEQVGSANAEIARLSQALASANEALEHANMVLADKEIRSRADLEAVQAARNELALQVEALNAAKSELEHASAAAMDEAVRLHAEIGVAEAERIASMNEAARLRAEVSAAEADRAVALDILRHADAAMVHLRGRLSMFAENVRSLIGSAASETMKPGLDESAQDEADRSLVARVEALGDDIGALNEQVLGEMRAAIDGARDDVAVKATEIAQLSARLAEAHLALTQARGAQSAAERMRQETVLRVDELRRALDAMGLETTAMRAIMLVLAARYSAVLEQLQVARRRDPAVQIPRLIARVKGRKRTSNDSNDLFLLENSIYFDKAWYLESYPDVAASGINPARHYLLYGAFENRDPGPWFSTSQYLLNNPDVAAAGANALLHFVYHGEREGRSARAAPIIALPREQPAPVIRDLLSCIYITGEPESAGHRYRVMDFVEAASANNVAATWVRAGDLAARHDELAQYDIAVFWRVAWTEEVGTAMALLRRSGCKIVFDIDDLMTEPNLAQFSLIDGIRSQSLTEEMVRSHYARVRQTMLEADACITTTEELAFYMRRVGKTTYVITNGFTRETHDLSRLSVRIRRKGTADDLIRIGYAGGSKTHQRDFAMCVEGLTQILREEPRCRLVLFRTANGPLLDPAEFPQLARMQSQIEWRDAVPLAELPREMARFDINLAPLEFGNPYCEAKSELKFFEAALVDVPTIASPTGPFRRAIDHGKTGFLAAGADDWLVCLRRLVNDAALRSAMGTAAYHAALGRFGPETKALRFGNVIEQLRGGVAAARGFALDARLVNRRPPAPGIYPSEIIFERDKLKSAAVTVVVPLYNYEDLIEEALDSVSAQTVEILDLVIVDGHSTDGSIAVARRWAERNADRFNRIIVLQNLANYGLGFCRNSGIDAAETPYVVLLDADNKLFPEACRELADHAKRTGAAFVYPTIQHFGASTALIGNLPFEPQRFAAGNYIDAMALVSKEAWAMVGGVDHVRNGWEDYDFWCRIAELGLRGEWLNHPLAHYRVHPTSMQTVQTQVPENYRRLLENFKSRHPWVSLNDQEQSRRPPAARETLVPAAEQTRLDRLLPLLRCPVTHQKLGFDRGRSALHSFDGLRVWPIREGRPIFAPSTDEIVIHPTEHQSNSLPGVALDLIREAKGWVLNLSAGRTAERFDNVVEAEYAIFRHTDVVADSHALPFDDNVFDAAIVLNAFEHYRDPQQAAAELHRVLKPGGKLLIVTAFMQPLHEKPWHFYNCTRYGLEEWFRAFEAERLDVTEALTPNFTLGWVASEVESAIRGELGTVSADQFRESGVGDLIDAFRDPTKRDATFWADISRLSQPAKEIAAAGFEFVGSKGDGIPIYVK